MKSLNKHMLLALAIFMLCSCKKNYLNNEVETEAAAIADNSFIHRSGKLLVDGNNNPVLLKGVAFGNEVWSEKEVPDTHHNEEDFKRVKDMNMNAIRFYINYRTFESDNNPYQYKQIGWDWLDKNIAWAKKYNVYLIINMHAPQGGYQSQGTGDNLWNVVENQNRLSALWKKIAEKYKDEKQIIGFGLVNEPVPTNSKMQWQQLAQRIITDIRKVDQNHVIFIEKPIYIKGVNAEDEDLNFPSLTDENIVYEFHIYDPYLYTHQLLDFAKLGDGGKYPDENIISYTYGNWYTGTFNSPKLNEGSSDWKFFTGEKYKINDPKINIGLAALVGGKTGGRVYFDDITIKEFDADGKFLRDVFTLCLDDLNGWNYWSSNNSGKSGIANTGRSNGKSLYIEATTDDSNLSNSEKVFIPKQNYSYQISGWMKGENIVATANCNIRLDFITTTGPVLSRTKKLLEASLQRYFDWANRKNVPLYMGEFGVGINCFKNNKGGLQWVTDMLDISKANNLNFTYHAYHEDSFGLYFGYGTLPDPAKVNQPLIDLFKQKLQ